MSDTITALCPDGKHRAFHVGHIKAGTRHGYVFASNKRVYGTITPGTSCFVPNADGKHAHLVRGVFEQPVEVDQLAAQVAAITDHASTEDVIDDQRADVREEIERNDFALANSVD